MPHAVQALALTGAVMGSYSIKVVRSKTAIVPVNASLLPRTEEESERCKRTVYVTNIDLGVEVRVCAVMTLFIAVLTVASCFDLQPAEVSGFFETLCGPVAQLHLTKLDSQGTQVAFVEFSTAHAADRALSCGGARLKVRACACAYSRTALSSLALSPGSIPLPASVPVRFLIALHASHLGHCFAGAAYTSQPIQNSVVECCAWFQL